MYKVQYKTKQGRVYKRPFGFDSRREARIEAKRTKYDRNVRKAKVVAI